MGFWQCLRAWVKHALEMAQLWVPLKSVRKIRSAQEDHIQFLTIQKNNRNLTKEMNPCHEIWPIFHQTYQKLNNSVKSHKKLPISWHTLNSRNFCWTVENLWPSPSCTAPQLSIFYHLNAKLTPPVVMLLEGAMNRYQACSKTQLHSWSNPPGTITENILAKSSTTAEWLNFKKQHRN